ncbi:hypothetical protein BCR39DRAFT_509892 [Naematelia encephala]|uniref:Iron-sulfur assembly protein 1 n=1 Tax=Naematelia encephala TaxID=71784 RepID=A0A1Y2BLC8_9TREE|nr:hypothetical protein BCR39DRAFT_509892 [Naematelia encephala]
MSAGPSSLRCMSRTIPRQIASCSRLPLPLSTFVPHSYTTFTPRSSSFSTSSARSSPFSTSSASSSIVNITSSRPSLLLFRRQTRSVHALARPIDNAGGFEGVPAAAYIGSVGVNGKSTEDVSTSTNKSRPTIRAKKSAITMTPAAITRLRELVSSPTEPKLLRIGVKSRGCAGMAYHLDYVPPPGGRFDEVVEQDGVRVLIDSKALFSIIGSVMDWRDNRLSAGFVFDNPNVVDTCGCGESFNIQ